MPLLYIIWLHIVVLSEWNFYIASTVNQLYCILSTGRQTLFERPLHLLKNRQNKGLEDYRSKVLQDAPFEYSAIILSTGIKR